MPFNQETPAEGSSRASCLGGFPQPPQNGVACPHGPAGSLFPHSEPRGSAVLSRHGSCWGRSWQLGPGSTRAEQAHPCGRRLHKKQRLKAPLVSQVVSEAAGCQLTCAHRACYESDNVLSARQSLCFGTTSVISWSLLHFSLQFLSLPRFLPPLPLSLDKEGTTKGGEVATDCQALFLQPR